MKVRIGPYRSWFGPYQLAEALCFWAQERDEHGFTDHPQWVHDFGEWLAHGSVKRLWEGERPKTWLYRFLLWIDSFKQRRISIRIDPWDTYSMDHTLALIVLPMLRQLQTTKHGAPHVDDEDVPEDLRSTAAPPLTQEQQDYGSVDDNHFRRWDWVLSEMIWAFEQEIHEDADQEFWYKSLDLDDGESRPWENISLPHLHCDEEGLRAWQERKNRGFLLFGKYYQALWD